jgi:hypothetical protein
MEEDRDSLHISKERRETREMEMGMEMEMEMEMEMWVCVRPVVKREDNAKAQMQSI